MPTIQEAIDDCINKHNGEMNGTENLAIEVGARKWQVIMYARRLASTGKIKIIFAKGGRGHKTVYKRNRNQAGQPRRTR